MPSPRPSISYSATWRITSVDDLATLRFDAIDAHERAAATAMRSASARSQFVSRRARLRDEMAFLAGVGHEDVRYWREPCSRCGAPHGRPRAAGFSGYFSTSSTPDLVALAVHDAPVGIDVERLASEATVRDVTPQLHPHERRAVEEALARGRDGEEGGTIDDRDVSRKVFTQIWTRKEALLKATGEGLTAPLDRDDVSDPTTRPVPGWRLVDITDDLHGWGGVATFGAWASAV